MIQNQEPEKFQIKKEKTTMKKWVCTVCGYVYEGENPPEKCPQCGVPASKFKEQKADEMAWACEHEVGVAQGSPEDKKEYH